MAVWLSSYDISLFDKGLQFLILENGNRNLAGVKPVQHAGLGPQF